VWTPVGSFKKKPVQLIILSILALKKNKIARKLPKIEKIPKMPLIFKRFSKKNV
jgi:hypothetical protein